ncbi:MAG: hypothetical protein IPM22_11960 [Betaproteobacteria bacterium]|nr:hypothetical protein [Betaproteobacteria bacterium]MCC7217174.1 hypothetical protein [Burkholderiales bacterium]
MMHTTTKYRFPRRARALRPVFGLAAAFAAAATFGLAVVAPATMHPAEPTQTPHVDARAPVFAPTEVAILPGTIEVVATRSRSTTATGQYQPATWRSRG